MIRTPLIERSTIPAIACRRKLRGGKSGVVIQRSDMAQPGLALVNRADGAAFCFRVPTQQGDALLLLSRGIKAEGRRASSGRPPARRFGSIAPLSRLTGT